MVNINIVWFGVNLFTVSVGTARVIGGYSPEILASLRAFQEKCQKKLRQWCDQITSAPHSSVLQFLSLRTLRFL